MYFRPQVRVRDLPQWEDSGEMGGLGGNNKKNGLCLSRCRTVTKTLYTGPYRPGQSAHNGALKLLTVREEQYDRF